MLRPQANFDQAKAAAEAYSRGDPNGLSHGAIAAAVG